MAERLSFAVHGLPAPQGSKRHVGNGIMVESSKHVRPWREAVKDAAWVAATQSSWQQADGPVVLSVVFFFHRPKSHWRTGRNSDLLRAGVPTAPAGKPDLSKLVRSTEDALTDAGIWRDDAQVTDLRAQKRYTGGAGLLLVPGAAITVYEAP
jgi:Holliday junction resolvase RusA-like endonuclease